MKLLYWAWGAILADFALFVGALPLKHDMATFVVVCTLHALCCLVLTASTWRLLPLQYRQPWMPVALLLFCFAFMAPVIGAASVLLMALVTLRREGDAPLMAIPLSVSLPEYDVRSEQTTRAGQGAIRVRLGANVPESVRMKSLLTLQAVPQRVANPILEDLLGDETDDVRLVAFGMLDAEEKVLSEHIRHERAALDRPLSTEQRYECLRRLSELHWELIYASLAQGELRNYMLDEARRHADAALACNPQADGGLHFLHGRILMALGEYDEAVMAIGNAVSSGLSEVSALPYLAEIAFRKRRFAYVHGIMQRLSELELSGRTRAVVTLWTGHVDADAYDHLSPRTQAIVDLWTGRDSVYNFCDHRILHHL